MAEPRVRFSVSRRVLAIAATTMFALTMASGSGAAMDADHPAASVMYAIAAVLGGIAAIWQARAIAGERDMLVAHMTELRERVARLEERSAMAAHAEHQESE